MREFRLVRPAKEHQQQAMEYLDEFHAEGVFVISGDGRLEKFKDDYDGWLAILEEDRRRDVDDGYGPAETFFLMKKSEDGRERLIGMINIRLNLNEKAWRRGGNIGYSIRPSERRRGYNKINLFLALCFCQRRGIEAVLLDCLGENIGSVKTIRALGGRLIRECWWQKTSDEQEHIQFYVIDIASAITKYSAEYDKFVAEYPA